ncbi:Fe(3+) ABC transporter substrate-binding protein [Prochlorothrix hollandica]|nr:Fe(3+) ABC transporter substrate-binding protein [Prochlorothrix hollandica]
MIHPAKLTLVALASLGLLLSQSCQKSPEAADPTDPAGSGTTAAPTQPTETAVVNLYSARHYDVDETLYQEFQEKTGIEVQVIQGEADELIERIRNEGAQSPADVFMAADAGRLWRAAEAGILQPVDSAVLEASIPEYLREPTGLWFGLTKRARVLVYNPDRVQPTDLSTYEALAEPQWQGRVCVRSSSNIYNQSLLGSMIETLGVPATEAWAAGLVANLARPPEGGDTNQIEAVAAGQCDVAIVNHYYWARMAKSDQPAEQEVVAKTAIFFPNQDDRGTHVNISGGGVTVSAPHRDNAVALLEFLVTPEAQAVFAEGNNEYPVVEGVSLDPIVAKLGKFKVDEVNVASYGRNNPEVVKLVDRVDWR